jgi:hypothetical protein
VLNLIKGVHTDGITSIEVVEEYDIFATSSFDCCCHIYSFKTLSKIGSLILGIFTFKIKKDMIKTGD